jgi:bifunctional non-homologous end joining protein LigD
MTTQPSSESVTLYYRDGGSDKVYMARIEAADGGYVVNFAFGRRGNTLQTGIKTPKPVDYDTARKAYDKLVREKMAKGYTPGEDGTPYQHTSKEERATGIFPQLLNPIDEGHAMRLIEDPDWFAQEKFDGKRILVRKDGDQVTGINRKGLTVALAQPIADSALTLGGRRWLMDGEAIGDLYVAFDLLEQDDADLRQGPYSRRLDALTAIVTPGPKGAIRVVDTATDTKGKQAMLAALRRDNKEGVVFKRQDAPYVAGRPAGGGNQLKLKFTATASCIVAKASRTKRSVALELLDGDRRVGVGNVTIPGKQPIPPAGSVVEVRFLYAFPGGSLYQPVYLGQRDDISTEACILGQLKYKAGESDDVEA